MIALFCEDGYAGTEYILRIGSIDEIRAQLSHVNDWSCLVENGRAFGPATDEDGLNRLSDFLRSCSDRKDVESLNIELSTGSIRCVMCADTMVELNQMKEFLLRNADVKGSYAAKVRELFDEMRSHLSSSEDEDNFSRKVSRRQYFDSGIAREDYP